MIFDFILNIFKLPTFYYPVVLFVISSLIMFFLAYLFFSYPQGEKIKFYRFPLVILLVDTLISMVYVIIYFLINTPKMGLAFPFLIVISLMIGFFLEVTAIVFFLINIFIWKRIAKKIQARGKSEIVRKVIIYKNIILAYMIKRITIYRSILAAYMILTILSFWCASYIILGILLIFAIVIFTLSFPGRFYKVPALFCLLIFFPGTYLINSDGYYVNFMVGVGVCVIAFLSNFMDWTFFNKLSIDQNVIA